MELLKPYSKPQCHIIEINILRFLCASGNLGNPGDYGDGGDPFSNSPVLNVYEEFNIVPDIDKFDAVSLFE